MSLLDRIRRNREQSVLPEEVQEYYQTEKRQRRGLAIILALVALLVTILVAAGLFFGGRWIYRKFDNKNDKQAESSQGQVSTKDDTENKTEQSNNSNSAQSSPTGTENPTPPAPTTPTPQPAPANPTTPALGDNTLPHTGDEGL